MSQWFETDFDHDSDILFISMGSQKASPKKFEWKSVWTNMHKNLIFKKMYIVDFSHSWWHAIKESEFDGNYGPVALAKFIESKIAEADVSRVYIMGSSMGGYGALLLGSLINIDEVFAFSPQTFLSEQRYRKRKLREKFKDLDIDYSLTDIKNILEGKYTKTIFHVYYPSNYADRSHAKRIGDFPNVKLHPVDRKGHVTASALVKNGTVTKILKRVTNEDITTES